MCVKQSRYMPWRLLGKRRYSSYSFTTSALDEDEWSASRPGRVLAPGKGPPGTNWTGGWVDPRAGLDTRGYRKNPLPLPGIEPRSPGRPVRCQTLYWLSYPGSYVCMYEAYEYFMHNHPNLVKYDVEFLSDYCNREKIRTFILMSVDRWERRTAEGSV
jgi:hypothetical protein